MTRTETTANAAQLATVTRNRYLGNDTHSTGGFNVYLGGEQVLAGLPQAWADEAARLINALDSLAAQADEIRRITAAVS